MTTETYTSRELYFRLLRHVRPYWRAFVIAIVCLAVTAATEPLFPALMKPLLDGSFGAKSNIDHYWFPLGIAAIFLVRGGVGFIADYVMAWVANRVVFDLRQAMFERLIQLPTRFFDDQTSGVLQARVTYNVTEVTGAATNVITVLIRDTLALVGLLGWLLWLNWQLTLIALTLVPTVGIFVRLFSKRLRRVSRSSQASMGHIAHVLEEVIEAHKVVKIFGGQAYESRRFRTATNAQRGFNMRSAIAAAALGPLVQIASAIALAVIVSVALAQAHGDTATVGGFVSFITAMLMLLAPLKRLTDVNVPLQRGLAAAEGIFTLIDEVPEIDQGSLELGRGHGEIAFDHLTFSYPGAELPALCDITLEIAAGETVALVGTSGSGKTTLANMVARFYVPTTGRVLVDGHDVASIKLASLRSNVALVSQHVVLFNDTIAANIAYGSMADASRETVREAARAAHALDFIEALPQGFDTPIGENGIKLSGGQRQRLAIARALLKNAPILVLDEATSALDSESERHVQVALEGLMQGRTTLVIAHRLSTIERADRIVVLEHGRIIEVGSHAQLMTADGRYSQLYRLQHSMQSTAGEAG